MSLYFMWISEVAMKVWTRGCLAYRTAFHADSRSLGAARERPQITGA